MTKVFALLRAPPNRLLALAAVIALLLGLPSLGHGFMLDDHVHRYAARGFPGPMSGLNLFTFATGNPAELTPFIKAGPYPWWTDPELRLVLFRPLSTALIYLDDALFGDAPFGWHLHSLLWSMAFVLAGGVVLRRLTSGALFGVAVLLLAFDEARWMPTAWLANRNALVAGTFALLSFALHLRWRQEGTKWAAPLSAVSLAIGLCGGEAALTITGFFVAQALVERRARALVPLACVLVPYVVLYRVIHGGSHGSGIYIDPLDAPGFFALAAPGRFGALVGNLALNLPIDLWLSLPQLTPALMMLGGLTAVGACVVLFFTRAPLPAAEKRTLDLLVLGSVLALPPMLATFPASRMLLVPGLGAAGALAFVLRHLWRKRRMVLLAALGFIHLPFAGLMWMADQAVLGKMERMANTAVAKTELETDRADLRVLALTTGDAATFMYVPIIRTLSGAREVRYWIFSNAPKAHRLTRVSENALEFEVVDGHFVDTIYEQVVRTPQRPFHAGDLVQLDGATVEVLSVDGWAPKRIRVTLDRSLEAEEVRLLAWRDGALRRLKPPPVGETVELPFSEGVMAAAAREGP